MSIFSASDLTRFYQTGENEVASETPFLVDRVALDVKKNQSLYVLPDYVYSIKRLTYLGQGLDPLPRRNEREVFQGATQIGTPFWYVYNNVGLNTIKLFPTPPTTIPLVTGNLWQAPQIRNGVIAEFYRATDNVNFIIPTYMRRQLLKKYVGLRAFGVEGANQNIKLSDYFRQEWETAKVEFEEWIYTLYTQPRRLVINDYNTFNYFPGQPILPINRFGISVDVGE